MDFRIDELNENELEQLILRDETTGTYISLLPQHGALLHAFGVPVNDHILNIIDHYENAGVLQRELNRSFKGAKLSPFVCRIPQGSYYHENVKYQFTEKFSDGSAIHGLLYNKPFRVLEKSSGPGYAKVVLEYDYKKDDPGYPFLYRCTIAYSLAADNLVSIQTTITNLGSSDLPVADGWHPYFRLGGAIDDWLMHFETIAQVAFDKDLIPTGELLPYTEFNEPVRIGHREMDDCFLISVKKDMPSCELFNPENRLKLSFYPSNNYPYLQIYTPPNRQSIAIENLSAAPDSFNNQMGLALLPEGDSQTFYRSLPGQLGIK